MNNNIDLTKILKDCPNGWKFYTPVWGEVTFIEIKKNKDCLYPICIYTNTSSSCTNLTKDGRYLINRTGTECILFPSKEQRDWSKFTAPWYKKERDTIAWLEETGKKEYGLKSFKDEDVCKFMQYIEKQAKAYEFNLPNRSYDIYAFAKDLLVWLKKQGKQEEPQVYETEDGKIVTYSETDGYKFVEPKFKVGDWIITPKNEVLQITSIEGTNYRFNNESHYWEIYCCDEQCRFWTIEDAKDGDVIHLGTVTAIFKKYIGQEKCICYCSFCKDGGFEIPIENGEDNVYGCYNATPATKEQRDSFMKAMNDVGYEWNIEKKELNKKKKFDPKTLKPFDKVLVRDKSCYKWMCELFSYIKTESEFKYWCISNCYKYCIPYNNDTKHLVGTKEEAPEHYKYWED